MSTLFTKIIRGEIPSKKLFENEWVVAIEDIAPKAPVHVLIITKKEIPSIHALSVEDAFLLGEIVAVAQQLAIELGIVEEGYRLVTNCGEAAGQTIPHLHFHLLGGRELGWMG